MSFIKHIFVLTIMIAFTFNATAGFAAGMCGCDHPDSQMMEMPCHDAESAKADQVEANNPDQEQKSATCTMCKCGHCKSHSHMSMNGQRANQEIVTSTIALMPHSDVITSLIICGIDNPPKHIS